MKKVFLLAAILGIAGLVAYELLSKKEIKPEEKKEAPLLISKKSDAFNMSLSNILDNYYALKAALVDWDSLGANHSASNLLVSADRLKLSELKADSNIVGTARSLVLSISSETKGLIGENNIEQKRRAFNMLTDELYNLIRTVRYDREIIYHIKCPMAFNDSSEAYWLSNTSKIVNPYLGNKHPVYKTKMLGCGEIIDSLDFSKK
ncbi:MAG TPA: DUF3347 domain-containing protein [Puia sp.]|nr:DUF3347 domain-containing protein [Puia sp.]